MKRRTRNSLTVSRYRILEGCSRPKLLRKGCDGEQLTVPAHQERAPRQFFWHDLGDECLQTAHLGSDAICELSPRRARRRTSAIGRAPRVPRPRAGSRWRLSGLRDPKKSAGADQRGRHQQIRGRKRTAAKTPNPARRVVPWRRPRRDSRQPFVVCIATFITFSDAISPPASCLSGTI
jgi:hypothetical protein